MVHVLWQQEVMCGASHGACFVAAGSDVWDGACFVAAGSGNTVPLWFTQGLLNFNL